MVKDNIVWWMSDFEKSYISSIEDPKQRLAWEMLSGILPVIYNRTPELRKQVVDKAELKDGERLLLIGEEIINCGLSTAFRNIVGKKGVVDEVETGDRWRCGSKMTIVTDVTNDKPMDSYDAAVLTGLHHVSDLANEIKNLAKVVRGGGKVVLVDHGPRRSTFTLATMDGYLSVLTERAFRGAAISLFPDLSEDDAYSKMQEVYNTPKSGIVSSAKKCLEDVTHFNALGFLIVDGRVGTGSQW